MERIVSKGICIDLHIHSIYSKKKDGKKVSNNTIANLPILVDKLKEHGVNLCAITDHDTFNYEIYSTLKEEESNNNCIQKVLPGIEFSVEFVENKVIHIVTIFDDKDDNKVKNIERIMVEGIGKTTYNKEIQAYTKHDYLEILNEIGVDFIMIAHQKNSVLSEGEAQSTDVMSLGKDVFNELVFMDYFDAYEFRNKKNELYNKVYTLENNFEDRLRFVTGSDCHNWSCYPDTEPNQKTKYSFTYIKALPTFKGVAMAITEPNRIDLTNNFFNPAEFYINEILLDVDDEPVSIPLSKGINVIIGDNSVGKSLFLHALTEYRKTNGASLIKGYQKYLNKNKIVIRTVIPEEKIFKFNTQGEIKNLFDSEGLKPDQYLKQFYPNEINATKYREIVNDEFEKLYESLELKFEYDKGVKSLKKFIIPKEELLQKNIIFVEEVEKKDYSSVQNLNNSLENAIKELRNVLNSNLLSEDDVSFVDGTIKTLLILVEKYQGVINNAKKTNEKINVFSTFMNAYKQKSLRKYTDEQSLYATYVESKKEVIRCLKELLSKRQQLKRYIANVETTQVMPETNPVDKYHFVSKIGIEEINNNYIEEVISNIITKGKKIDTLTITEDILKNLIKRYPSTEGEISALDVLKEKINTRLDADFKIRNAIVENKKDMFIELSSGFDAQMYFTLLSGETRNKGMYLIDQPEDHISQKGIKENMLKEFTRMGQNRQVIMVTHNPQFIVNLDVDNVIFLSKEHGKFCVKSGALEYENDEYSILQIVADNIEGGLATIMGRMKRYEKNI